MIAPFVASRKRTYHQLRRNTIAFETAEDPESTQDPATAQHPKTRRPQVWKTSSHLLRGDTPEEASEMKPTARNAAPVRMLRSRQANSPKVYQGVPLADRICVTIRPDDERFVEAEAYFNSLLRSDKLSMQEILDRHFSKHEIEKFVPTNQDPVRQWQAENTAQFQDILKSQFRGKLPTLACKMAMHWFGLPVAPMKLLWGEMLRAYNFDKTHTDEPEETNGEEDPLAFLDDHEGYMDGSRLPGIAPGHIPTLRGGHLDADAMDTILSDIEDTASELWDRQASNQLTVSLRGGAITYDQLALHIEEMGHIAKNKDRQQELMMYGRQGYTSHQPSWAGFLSAVRYLLTGATQQDGVVLIGVDLFEPLGGKEQGWKLVGSQEGPLLLDTKKEDKDGTIKEFVTANMNLSHAREEKRVCYVRLSRDLFPDSPVPQDKGHVELVHEDGGGRRGAYMRIPSAPSEEHLPSQYFDEFRRAIRNLLPGYHYSIDLRLMEPHVDTTPTGIMHIGDDPRPVFARLVARAHSALRGDGLRSLVRFAVACKPDNPDVLWLLTPQHQAIGTYPKSDLCDLDALVAAAARHYIPNASVGKSVGHFEFWLPAQSFSDDMRTPFILEYVDGGPSPRSKEAWRLWVEGMKRANPEIYTAGFSIMMRPIYRQYRLVGRWDGQRILHVLKNLLSLDIEAFKSVVSFHLYPQQYDPFDRGQVLVLCGLAAQHVVRYDSTDRDWHRIRRRFAEGELNVELKTDKKKWERETRWDVNASSYWGPCYGQLEELQSDQVLADTMKSMAIAWETRAGPGDKSNNGGPKANMEELESDTNTFALNKNMREQTVWKLPSIFANPLKPTMPIHAPPVESLLKVGPRMPTVTLAMRTPTEMVHLQNEVHCLRGQMLDRVRECPYADCDQYFAYGEVEALDRHLKKDHPILRCPLCFVVGKKQTSDSLFFADPDRALRHFREEHLDQVLRLAQVPTETPVPTGIPAPLADPQGAAPPTPASGHNYCHQCGRDNIACDQLADRMHHALGCANIDNKPQEPTHTSPDFCRDCGVKKWYTSCENPDCPDDGFGRYCNICGVSFGGWSKLYQAQHKTGCRPQGGKTADYCGYCGTSLRDLSTADKQQHGVVCQARNGSVINVPVPRLPNSDLGGGGQPLGNTNGSPVGPPGSRTAGAHPTVPTQPTKKPQPAPPKPKTNSSQKHQPSKTTVTNTSARKAPATKPPVKKASKAVKEEDAAEELDYSDNLEDDDMYDDIELPEEPLGAFEADEASPVDTESEAEPEAAPHSKKRKRRENSADPEYRRGQPQDEPEEEVDDRTGHRDGAPEDFSIMRPGMKEIPGQWKSPIELFFPRNKARTPKPSSGETAVPAPKRSKEATPSSREGTPAPATRGSSRLGTVRAMPGGASTKKPKSTKKAAVSKPVTSEVPLTPLPGREVLPAPPTITRKSGRISKKTKDVAGAQLDEGADDAASNTAEAPSDPIEAGMRAAKTLAKAPLKKPAVKSPAKRGRKKAAV